MDRRTQLESAVAENTHLRGLLALPVAGLMLLSALGNWEVGPLRHAWVFVAGALLIGASWLALKHHYDERYGRMTPSARQQRRAGLAVLICLPLVFGGSLLLSSRASWSLDLPVNPIAVTLALAMALTYAMSVGLKPHHRVVFGALLVTGLVPVWERGGESGNAGLALAALAVAVAGVLDHRLLVRTFGPPRAHDTPAADARA